MPHATPLIALISLGVVLAFMAGYAAQRLRLSPLVGYLLAGVIIGPFTPGFIADQGLANQLAEIGVILLMFGVGLHFSLEDLLEVRKTAIPGALAGIAAATALGWLLAWNLGWPPVQCFVFGLALSVASTVVLLRSLEEHRLLSTGRGKLAIGWVIVEDLVMVLALVFLPVLAHSMVGGGNSIDIKILLISLGTTIGKLAIFVALMLLVGRRAIPWLLERVAGSGSRELFTLSILAIALGVAFGSANLFGVSFALGAFFAGMLLNESELSHKAAADTLPMRDAFAVLFFVSVGMLFNPSVIIEKPFLVLATFMIITIGKPFVAMLVVHQFKHKKATTLTIGASLSQIGEFSFILASLGVGMKLLPEQGRDLILAGALLSIVINPMLFAALGRWRSRSIDPAVQITASLEPPPGPAFPRQNHTILIGYGRVGSHLAALLQERGVALMVVDDSGDLVEKAHARGIAAIRGNAANVKLLKDLSIETATHALVAIPNAFEAGEIIARLRAANPKLSILARAHSESAAQHFFDHGADGTVVAERELAHSMAEMVLNDPSLITSRKAAE
ncbi:MAG: YbaL family putative K(+) efflux transporter [Arenimonas sp.]